MSILEAGGWREDNNVQTNNKFTITKKTSCSHVVSTVLKLLSVILYTGNHSVLVKSHISISTQCCSGSELSGQNGRLICDMMHGAKVKEMPEGMHGASSSGTRLQKERLLHVHAGRGEPEMSARLLALRRRFPTPGPTARRPDTPRRTRTTSRMLGSPSNWP